MMNALGKHSLNSCKQPRLALIINVCVTRRNYTESSTKEEKSVEVMDDVSIQEREQDIERIRDKSRLKVEHRNMLFNKIPYSQPMTEAHLTIKYNRKMYGKFGSESGVYPGVMWPTKADVELRKEYEKIAYPFTIQELVAQAKTEIEERELNDLKIHERVISNLAKLELWKKELKDKVAKKEAEALAAKEKKDKLIEEVRRHFGFTVDPRDEKFKEMLAVKEKEQKKREKQARLEERERKSIAKLMARNEALLSATNSPDKNS
uniref:Large ribosomal subunit protein mL64 n=1 Tax=Graphocephala atropunctata TaxID=36148 RepID=A0A1B6MNJ5_9HEMI